MKIIYMGTPDFAVEALKTLIKSKHEVTAVVTQPDTAKGRSGALSASPVKEIALEAGIEVYQPEKLKANGVYEKLASYEADAFVVAAYGKIIPKNILELPRFGCINVHASLLPKYRGAAPIQWAILDGEEKTGVTIMQMNEGLDTGDIISQSEVVIEKKETAESLFDKLALSGAELLIKTMDEIESGSAVRTPQPEASPTAYSRMITKSDGKINWADSAEKIERQVRAMNSWPGAYTLLDEKNIKLWDCDIVREDSSENPGSIVRADKNALLVKSGDALIKINELQLQGKKRMPYDVFLRGNRWEAGMKFDDR